MGQLEAVLRDMINTVIEEEGLRITHTLQRGLQIDIRRNESVISVLLSRGDTYPSQLEEDIVMSHFPDGWKYEGHEEIVHAKKYWLKTLVTVPEEVVLGRPYFKFEK